MTYSSEEIQKYTDILHNFSREVQPPHHVCTNFEQYLGQHLCIECGRLCGHILGQYDINDFDRLHYQKKSLYHRKYYFEKKVNKIAKLLELNDKVKSEIYNRLLELDSKVMSEVNKKYNRKRIINIDFIIIKILKEIDNSNYKFTLKISSKLLILYNSWWKSYCKLAGGVVGGMQSPYIQSPAK